LEPNNPGSAAEKDARALPFHEKSRKRIKRSTKGGSYKREIAKKLKYKKPLTRGKIKRFQKKN